MGFAHLTRLASILFTPSDFLLLLLILGVILQRTRLKRWGNGLVIAVAASLVSIMIFPVDRWLIEPLENRYSRGPWPAHVDGIVVLGGGEDAAVFAARGVQAPDPAEGRLIAGAELARRYPGAKLIFSGGTAAFARGRLAEADVARAIYAQMGLAPARVIPERHSRNTWENLRNSQKIANPKPGETWVLVTSALHMPRSLGIAAKLHWRMLPWPADYITTGRNEGESWNDSLSQRLGKIEAAVHEWLGLAVYRLSGRWTEPGNA